MIETSRVPEAELRYEIVRACQLLHQKNYLSANDGNISVRLGGGRILITPTGVHKGFLKPEDLVVIDDEGRLLSGARPPSGEVSMHLTALRRRPDMNAVIHAHAPTCIALSLLKNVKLNGILPEVILSVGELVVCPYGRPVSEALGEALLGYIEKNDALILERHGTLTVGKTVAEAYYLTERLEHAAHVLWLAYSVGRPTRLPEDEAGALLAMYREARAAARPREGTA